MYQEYELSIRSRIATERARFSAKLNEYCPICCAPASARGIEIVVCLNGTAEVVCLSCALQHDPALGYVFHEYTDLLM